jgi:hypothetical protein
VAIVEFDELKCEEAVKCEGCRIDASAATGRMRQEERVGGGEKRGWEVKQKQWEAG